MRCTQGILGDWARELHVLECKCEGFDLKLLENGEPLSVYEEGMCNDPSHTLRQGTLWQGTVRPYCTGS